LTEYVLFIILIIVIVYFLASYICDKLSFLPSKVTFDDVHKLKRLLGEKIQIQYIKTPDGNKIMGVLYNRYRKPSWNDKIIFYSHGNGGWIGTNITFTYVDEFSKYGSIFMYDYHGYGVSGGSPSENNLYTDVLEAWNYVTDKKKVNVDNIVVFGHSLGTSLSSYLLRNLKNNNRRIPKNLILSAPFYNFSTISKEAMPGIGWAQLNYFATNKYLMNIEKDVDILYLHSKHDQLIRLYHSYKLNKIAPGKVIVITGTHNDPLINTEGKLAIKDIFTKMDAGKSKK
jgi:acetyl esterase/lipase